MRPGHVLPERLTCRAELATQRALRTSCGHVPRLNVIGHVPVVGAGVAALTATVGARVIQYYLGFDNLIQGPGVLLREKNISLIAGLFLGFLKIFRIFMTSQMFTKGVPSGALGATEAAEDLGGMGDMVGLNVDSEVLSGSTDMEAV